MSAGALVLREGERSRTFYIVAEGTLEVVLPDPGGGQRATGTIEPMSIFGEEAFFDGLPQSVSVRARTEAELFGISPDALEVLSARHPGLARAALLDLGRILALRLRAMTAAATTARA